MICPICQALNLPSSLRCQRCAADFDDPDVRALAGAAAPGSSQAVAEAGALAGDRFMGVSHARLIEGSGVGLLALLGAIALLGAFLVPVSSDYRSWHMPWAAADGGPTISLFFAAAGAAAGIGIFLARGLLPWIRAAVLVGIGLAGFATLAPLGRYAAGPIAPQVLFTLGLLGCGVAIALRIYYPRVREVRYALAAAGSLVIVAMLLPLSPARDHLPAEFALSMWRGQDDVSASAVSTYLDGVGTHALVQFLSLWGLAPLAAIPAAAALAWAGPRGVWDKTSMPLRPLGYVLILYVPLTWWLYLFNMTGWSDIAWVSYKGVYAHFDDFTMAVTVGRAKIALAATCYAMWVCFGAVVLYHHLRLRPPAPRAGAT